MIDQTKLKNVVQKDSKVEAQCPACASAGGDSNGCHLVIFADGKYACVAHPGDKEHRKLIHQLVGVKDGAVPPLQVTRQRIPESSVIMKIGRLGRFFSIGESTGTHNSNTQPDTGVEKAGPFGPAVNRGKE